MAKWLFFDGTFDKNAADLSFTLAENRAVTAPSVHLHYGGQGKES